METKHTQSPWEVRPQLKEKKGDRKFYVYSNPICAECNKSIDLRHICVTLESAVGFEEAKANAKLIAAAPELLESLITILENFRSCIAGGNGELPEDKGNIEKAYRAIKKATE